MNDDGEGLVRITARLDAVEKENRWLKAVVRSLAVLACCSAPLT